jgi:hypothetical protein
MNDPYGWSGKEHSPARKPTQDRGSKYLGEIGKKKESVFLLVEVPKFAKSVGPLGECIPQVQLNVAARGELA